LYGLNIYEFKTQMIMNNRKEIVEKMINALNNRGGFDDWWYNIDEEIQTEITDELVNILPIQIVSKSVAKQYAEFCVRCDREGLPLIELDDYIKQYCC